MILITEMIISCVLFTVMVMSTQRKDPLSGLHNMPIALQERVASLLQYKDVKAVHTKQRIMKKIPTLIILMFLFALLIYISGARSFRQAFISSFLLWTVIKLYVVLVLDCIWLAHTPAVWIPGTEDMVECYQDYVFYLKSIPHSLLAGLLVSAVVGVIISAVV